MLASERHRTAVCSLLDTFRDMMQNLKSSMGFTKVNSWESPNKSVTSLRILASATALPGQNKTKQRMCRKFVYFL